MRIDVNVAALSQLAAEQDASKVRSDGSGAGSISSASVSHGSGSVPSGDTATLSSDARTRSTLASKALQSPAIRQEKVDALAQALHSGQYELSPGSIATAIVADRAK